MSNPLASLCPSKMMGGFIWRRGLRFIMSYFFSFSIPLVAPLPGFVAQQKAESSPHAPQLCFNSVCPSFGLPMTVKVELQPLHAWVPISSVGWPFSIIICAPFTPCLTRVTHKVLHLAHTIAMLSSVLSASTCSWVVMPWSIIICSPPFIGFIGFVSSAAPAVVGSPAASASARPDPRLIFPMVFFSFISVLLRFVFTLDLSLL